MSRLDELQLLSDVAAGVRIDHAIVELGAFQGHATRALAEGAQRNGAGPQVFAIDVWGLEETGQGPIYDDPANMDRFHENLAGYIATRAVVPVRMHTAEAAKLWDREIGLLLIDADHRYEGCLADYLAWGRWVVPGGRLMVHDCKNPAWPGVDRVVDEDIRPSGVWMDEHFCEPFMLAFRRREVALT